MTKALLRIAPLAMSVMIAENNLKLLKKKKKTTKDLVGQGVKNIVGIEMTKEIANFVESF